jgi:hypothetical protein
MVDRENLKNKAKAAGKSVAGTLGEKAQQLKSKAKTLAKDPDTGIEISEVNGQYLVIDGDGNATGPFDNRRNAAAKAREMKREMEAEGGKAAKFSQKVNETASSAKDKLQSAGEKVDTDGESGGSPSLFGGMDGDGDGPTLPGMEGPDGDGGGPTLPGMASESGEPSLPFMQDSDSGEGISMPFMTGESDGDQPSLPFMEDQTDEDAELPFMTDSDSDDEPQFPEF